VVVSKAGALTANETGGAVDLDLTFKAVCASLKDDAKQDPKVLGAIDKLLGLTIICAPVALGPAALALLPALSVKNELVKMGKAVFKSLTKKRADEGYFARLERLRSIHGLLVYTAFFDALDKVLPAYIRKQIDVDEEDRRLMAAKAEALKACEIDGQPASKEANEQESNPLAEVSIAFPHPTESFADQLERHEHLWKQLSQGFWNFLQMLAVWDKLSEKERKKLRETLEGLPTQASEHFEAQFLVLAKEYGDFAVWVNLHEHAATQEKMGRLGRDVKDYMALASECHHSVDRGLTRLHDVIAELPARLAKADADGIVESLAKHYGARLDDPIIEDNDGQSAEGPRLTFPKVQEAFVPQPFRVVRQMGQALHLEDEDTWTKIDRRDDLGPFLVRYLSSPYSVDAPLLLLGHPGSGKSLLTTVLAAHLSARKYSVVRVPLREVDADAGIVTQIEEAIRQVTHIRLDSWAKLSARFKDYPPVVILDGYDELLQASGQVYAGYLREVKAFQKSEAEQGRPVRIIVTSRVTLIDKAKVPEGSTVLRLLEFDNSRQQAWISVWNGANASYFRDADLEPFRLPDTGSPGAEKILLLAEQPLLLLMLALYDSQDNQLRESVALDRTRLYDELLRRFIKRERGKDREFIDSFSNAEQQKEINADMRRLGVAAIGMYNRRQVHILANQLEVDLKFFDMERSVSVAEGRPMSQADLLLGSFFFVHKSQARRGPEGEAAAELSAFEFLHNTLGEFLTADFVLRWTIEEVKALALYKSLPELRADYHKKLNSPDALGRQWFASLVYTPLFTRPVVLEMMREWSGHLVADASMAREEFAEHLDTVLHNQLERITNRRAMPSIMQNESVDGGHRAEFGDHPLIGHLAVYSLNLLLLRAIVCDRPFILNERDVECYEDGARPWDRLVHLWRSWFSLDALNGLTAVLEAVRRESVVEVRAKESFQVAEARSRLEVLQNVSVAIADDLTAGVAGLALTEFASASAVAVDELGRRLQAERIDSEFRLAIRRLRKVAHNPNEGFRELAAHAVAAASLALQKGPHEELGQVAMLFWTGARSARDSGQLNGHARDRWRELDKAGSPSLLATLMDAYPEAALLWVKALKVLAGPSIAPNIVKEVVERTMNSRIGEWHLILESPGSVLTWIDTLCELVSSSGPVLSNIVIDVAFRRNSPQRRSRGGVMILVWAIAVQKLGGVTRWLWRRVDLEMVHRFFDARFLLDVADRSPELGVALAQLLREWADDDGLLREMGPELVQRFVRTFVEQVAEAPHFVTIMDRIPEVALEIIRTVGALAQSMPLQEWEPEVLNRITNTGYLMHLSERSPAAALALIQLVRQLGGDAGRLWRMDPEVAHGFLDPRYLLEVVDRSPELSVALAQLLREWSDNSFLREVDPNWVQRFIKTSHLMRLIDSSPEVALELIRMVVSLTPSMSLQEWGPEVFERITDLRYLAHLSELGPAAGLSLIQLVWQVGGDTGRLWRRMDSKTMHRFLDPRYLLEVADRHPELAMALEQIGREIESDGGTHGRTGLVDTAIQRWLHRPGRNLHALPLVLRLASSLRKQETIRALGEAVVEAMRTPWQTHFLPIAVLEEIRLLAHTQEDPKLRDAILAPIRAGDEVFER
jgi:hypothetical protein